MVVEADCCLHFLCFAEAMLAFHSTRVQVKTSNLPSLIKVIRHNPFDTQGGAWVFGTG